MASSLTAALVGIPLGCGIVVTRAELCDSADAAARDGSASALRAVGARRRRGGDPPAPGADKVLERAAPVLCAARARKIEVAVRDLVGRGGLSGRSAGRLVVVGIVAHNKAFVLVDFIRTPDPARTKGANGAGGQAAFLHDLTASRTLSRTREFHDGAAAAKLAKHPKPAAANSQRNAPRLSSAHARSKMWRRPSPADSREGLRRQEREDADGLVAAAGREFRRIEGGWRRRRGVGVVGRAVGVKAERTHFATEPPKYRRGILGLHYIGTGKSGG